MIPDCYRRTPLMGGAVIMLAVLAVLAVLAIPVYLFRSRPSGQKLRAVLGNLGLLVLALLTLMLAGLPFELALWVLPVEAWPCSLMAH